MTFTKILKETHDLTNCSYPGITSYNVIDKSMLTICDMKKMLVVKAKHIGNPLDST